MTRQAVGYVVGRTLRLCLFAGALTLGGVIAYGVIGEPVHGSGSSVSEKRSIGTVTEVAISGSGNVELRRGEPASVLVTADDNILPLLETRNRNGKLTLQTRSGFSIHPVTPITYVVTVPRLEKLTISGTATVTSASVAGDQLSIKLSGAGNAILNDVQCKSLTLTLSGAGHIVLAGRAEKATLHISGAGDIDAKGFKAAAADTHISGAGTASVWATDVLKAKISGAGKIQYKGQPRIEQRVSGAGSVIALQE